jgi:hypothetical protein
VIVRWRNDAVLEPDGGVYRCGNASADGIAGRNPDGSIDYGYYRRQASRLRRAKLHESLNRAARYGAPLIAVAIAVLTMLAISAGGRQLPLEHADVVSFWMDDISQRIVGSSTRPFKANDERKI